MHTFFVNTSGKELGNYTDLFEIQHETRRLVSLDCPIAEWTKKETGYEACVHKMEELIDSYKGINNQFNLILYIDLLSYKQYSEIPTNSHRERYACLTALRSLLKHYITDTLVKKLKDCGRNPREVLLIFEENHLPIDEDHKTEDGKNLIRSYIERLLGFPSAEEIEKLVCVPTEEEKGIDAETFCQKAETTFPSPLGEALLHTFLDKVEVFLEEAKVYKDIGVLLARLYDRMLETAENDDLSVHSVSLATNRRAGATNKQEKTRRDLRLCFYIYSCVEDDTIFEKREASVENASRVKPFPEIDWEKVAAEFSGKGAKFQRKYKEVQSLSESFSELGLAPTLYALDHGRFALDEYGNRGQTFEIVDVKETDAETQEEKTPDDGVIRLDGKKEIVPTDIYGRSLFSEKEFPPFDYQGEGSGRNPVRPNATPEQYVAAAQQLRRHHRDYLKRLNVHVFDRLSNYAGRSSENDPALLSKRKVSVGEEDFDDSEKEYRYATFPPTEETRKLKTAQDVSATAYQSTILDYMEFCARRSVAVTNIDEQCNWFVTRVNQISESLKNLKKVTLGLLIATVALYIPFIVLQWSAITQNVLTLSVAAFSLAAPLVLLFAVSGAAVVKQRKKYYEAWLQLKQKSDQVIAANADSARKYDQLLSIFVPSLRWVYEYKLDVDFYADCCKMARAKIGHHLKKLHDRVITVGNIVEDLETSASAQELTRASNSGSTNNEIDYNMSFCAGEKNRGFYSIIDAQFLDSVRK